MQGINTTPMQQRQIQQFITPQPKIVNGKPTEKLGLDGALAIGSTLLQFGSAWWQNRLNRQAQQEQNEYNERMIDKQNEYNSPEQQIARLMEAGYTRSQAMSMLYTTPSSAVGSQTTAPSSADMTGKFAVPNLDTPMSVLDSFVGAGRTLEETNNIYQDTISKLIANKYADEMSVKTLKSVDLENHLKDAQKQIADIQKNIASQTQDANILAMNSEFMKQYYCNAPLVNLSPAELSRYTDMKVQELFHSTEESKETAQFMADMAKFRNDNIRSYKNREISQLGYEITHAKHEQKRDKREALRFDWEIGRGREKLLNMWDAEANANTLGFTLNANWSKGQIQTIESASYLYLLGQMSQWRTASAQADYNKRVVEFMDSHFGTINNQFKNVLGNVNALLQPIMPFVPVVGGFMKGEPASPYGATSSFSF